MPYVILKTDGTTLVTIPDGKVDNTTSLTLVGKNVASYGLDQNENFVKLLENFASTTQPSTPLIGQLWYDKTPTVSKLKVYNGSVFKEVGSAIVSATQPTQWNQGEFWLNSGTGQLYVNSQGTSGASSAQLIGPFSDPGFGKNGPVFALVSDGTTTHQTIQEYSGNSLLGIWSQDTFTPSPLITDSVGTALFRSLSTGLNISTEAQLNVFSNTGLFVGNFSQANISVSNGAPNVVEFTNTYANGQIQLRTNNATQLTVDGASGNVGIKTNIPSAPLDVAGIIQTNSGVQLTAGNLLVGGTAQPQSASSSIVIYNGTPPTSPVSFGAILYTENVYYTPPGSSPPAPISYTALQVMDSNGNVTTLSPHNFSLIPEGPSEPMAWSYYSENNGNKINVDMLKMARLLEKITGEKLVHIEVAQ